MIHIYRQVRRGINLVAAIEDRLARIESFVSDTAIVNTQQPWQLQKMINAVAEALFQHF